MKKKYIAVTLAATMAFGILAACSDKNNQNYTPTEAEEKVPLVLGIEGADGVYNPFFATAAYDSEIAGQTQIGMLTTSIDGEIAYGDEEACVVKDYTKQFLNSNRQPTTGESNAKYTQYDFLIKKGIKFSDGEDLTIEDVIFNLYVYLDPAYTGSSTIYSTDIVGLEEYRTQGKGDEASLNRQAAVMANDRLGRIATWCNDQYIINNNGGQNITGRPPLSGMSEEEAAETVEDIKYFLEYYDTELSNAYSSAESGFEEMRKSYMFEPGQYWQYFLYSYGLLESEKDSYNKPLKQFVQLDDPESGDYIIRNDVTEEDAENHIYEVTVFDWDTEDSLSQNGQIIQEVEALGDDPEAIRSWAIEKVYTSTVGTRNTEGGLPDFDYDAFSVTALGSTTTTTLYNYILSECISEVIAYSGKTISGIETYKTSSFDGNDLGSEYDVLRITINDVDPKAIWNFGFTVAPKHYYAPEDEARAASETNGAEDHPYLEDIGVVYNSSTFMEQVLKNTSRNRVPVGAGAYKASDFDGLDEGQKYPAPGEFEVSKRVYYERNEYFDTVDEQPGGGPIQNARIKYLQYQVVTTNTILQSLEAGTIDVGAPNCTTNNRNQILSINNSGGHLGEVRVETNGYGYVGINAGMDAVSNIWIRRAIMRAMDISIINGTTVNGQYQAGYFGQGNSEAIYRPMSKVSWAYPKECSVYNPSSDISNIDENNSANYVNAAEREYASDIDYSYDPSGQQILRMLEAHDFSIANGKVVADPDGKELMPITFTVAGETSDHPAYQMFNNAKEILEGIGFDITVETDINALSKLTYGGLTVWAAAWSSTIDPDMYQVYHKNSKASSTVNWGYDVILNKNPGAYDVEDDIIDELSDIIDTARTMTNKGHRAQYYAQALNLVMELAVEMPAYQRYDLTVFNNEKIDESTILGQDTATAYASPFAYIWKVGYNSSFTANN